MIIEKEQVAQILYEGIEELNAQLPEGRRLEAKMDTVLFGESGKLDSLGLVNLIIGAEEKIEERLGMAITIANERAMSQERSPFTTVDRLTEYVLVLLREDVNR